MSQKKHKKLRKLQQVGEEKAKPIILNVTGIVEIIKSNWKFLAMLLVGVLLVYANSIGGDFVSDDYATITQNPDIANFKALFVDFDLVKVVKFVIASIFGVGNPIPYHITSLLIYLMVCVLVFVYAYLITNKEIAVISSIIFAVLPVHVEAVSWISGVSYLLVALFVLLNLIFLTLFLKSGNKKYLYYVIFMLLPMFFADRVRSFAFFPLALVYILAHGKTLKVKVDYGKIFSILFLLGVVGVAIMWPSINSRLQNVNSGYNFSESIFYDPFFQYPTAIAKYLQLIFAPTDLTLYQTMYPIPSWLNWLILILYFVNVGYFWFKNKTIFFALVFIFLATAPSMAPVKVSWLVAERYVFLGSFGFSLFLGIIFSKLFKRHSSLAVVTLILLCILYSARIVMRNDNWSTNHKLWVNTVQVSSNSHNAWNNIGDDYDKLEDYENSIKGFTQSTVMKNNYADAYHNRANIFYKIGRYDLAKESYKIALHFSPELYQTYLSLIQIDMVEGNFKSAMENSEKLIELQPNNPQSYYAAGVVLGQSGRVDEAKGMFNQSLKIAPNFDPSIEALRQIKAL